MLPDSREVWPLAGGLRPPPMSSERGAFRLPARNLRFLGRRDAFGLSNHAPRSFAPLTRFGARVVIRTLCVLIGSRELRSRERLRPPRGCPFAPLSHRTAQQPHLTPPQPRRSHLKALATPSRVRLAAAGGGRSPARATATAGKSLSRLSDRCRIYTSPSPGRFRSPPAPPWCPLRPPARHFKTLRGGARASRSRRPRARARRRRRRGTRASRRGGRTAPAGGRRRARTRTAPGTRAGR